jgi:uncharacterized protein (DUF1800 family)
MHTRILVLLTCLGTVAQLPLLASDPPPPGILSLTSSNAQKTVKWTPYPAAQQYGILGASNVANGFTPDPSGAISGYTWTGTNPAAANFYRLQVGPMSSNALLTASVLNRLAYGPTPDELQRVAAIGPQAFIDEQMAPENLNETMDTTVYTVITNGGSWIYVTDTGIASSNMLFIYLDGAGEAYIDDIKLVAGSVPEAGLNLIQNGDFESAFPGAFWTFGTNDNLIGSSLSSNIFHSGSASLHILSTAAGTTTSSAIYQGNIALTMGATYTLSYWYQPSPTRGLTVRLANSSSVSNPVLTTPDNNLAGLFRRLGNAGGSLSDLRAWHCFHAVHAKRQLLEVLDQFLENHFVTEYEKSVSYFNNFYQDGTTLGRLSTEIEFRENQHWRNALLDPNVTFYDLLRISAQSPAMIIYLDTVISRGDGANIANENYARELMELFTMGVDNGYDQLDVTTLSRAWTGWRLDLVDPPNINNPFAPRTTNELNAVTNNATAITNLVGVWAFNYKPTYHNNTQKQIFYVRNTNGVPIGPKTVPARFGPPWAGQPYGLTLPVRSSTGLNGGTNGIQDGYAVVTHLSTLPFTEEFISVKLCRLLVHDNFTHGVYDYTDPNLSPEGQLVHQCMLAWETPGPDGRKGNLRSVLSAIFNSDLFRSHGGSLQKVKTPLEFGVSVIRALSAAKGDGTFTADTDGYSLISPLSRMGSMLLFDRTAPDGYPEAGPPWISAGTLAERLRFVQTFCMAAADPAKNDGISPANKNVSDPVGLIKLKLPSASWNDAGAVADYLISILFPGEGKANLDLYRSLAVNFLNTADNGLAASAFSSLSATAYDTRVRAVTAMLLTSPRFHEQ